MLKFERRDPFPLLADDSYSKKEAHAHSAEVDRWLGLRIDEIESKLNSVGSRTPAPNASGEHQQLWFGLSPQDLVTPYVEIRSTLDALAHVRGQHQHVVDLGAAYGRIGFVIERHFPRMSFAGYEYVGERVQAANEAFARFGAARSVIRHFDLTSPSFQLPDADIYFIYDYGTPKAIEKTLHDLKRKCLSSQVTVVARGRACRYAIESRHSWLAKSQPGSPERATTVYRSSVDFSWVKSPAEYTL